VEKKKFLVGLSALKGSFGSNREILETKGPRGNKFERKKLYRHGRPYRQRIEKSFDEKLVRKALSGEGGAKEGGKLLKGAERANNSDDSRWLWKLFSQKASARGERRGGSQEKKIVVER